MRKPFAAEIIILICFCVIIFDAHFNKKSQANTEYTRLKAEPHFNVEMHIDIVMNLISQKKFSEAIRLIDHLDSIQYEDSDGKNPLKDSKYYWSCQYAKGMNDYSNGDDLKAYSHLQLLNREKLPEILLEQFDADFQEAYDAAKAAYDQEVVRKNEEAEKKKQAYIDYINQKCTEIAELIENKNYSNAYDLAEDIRMSKDFSWDKLDDKTYDTFFSLYNYAKGFQMYKENNLTIADVNFNAVIRSSLPESLRKQFDKDYETVEAAYKVYWDAYMKDYYANASQGSSSSHSYYSDDFDVNDYSDAEEFYHYHRDDFYDYEDAEDYYNSNHK